MILDARRAKFLFLDIVTRAKRRYPFRIENFTVMGNHFHLIIQPNQGVSLSRIMQWILSVFAQTYNRLHNLCGHVWGERFFSRIIETLKEYLKIFEYIDNNPVRAGLIDHKEDWAFCGLSHRRMGVLGLVDPLPELILALIPQHLQLSIE